jgi:hypothetical protein
MSTTAPVPDAAIIAASFIEPDAAMRAIGALQDHGITARQISVATPHSDQAPPPPGDATDVVLTSDAAHTTPVIKDADGFMEVQTDDPPTPTDMNAATEDRRGGQTTINSPDNPIAAEGERALTTTTPADAARGAAAGSLAGLGIGLLAGAAALTVPGLGLVLAAGPLWAALVGTAGATAAGAVAGGAVGYLRDMGVPEGVAHHHAVGLTRGSVVVAVHLGPHNDPATITGLLHKYGGSDVAAHDVGLTA